MPKNKVNNNIKLKSGGGLINDANVPITTLFSGFSGLLTGYEYYIKSDASGISGNTTYQKIGVAINDTTILK